MKRKCNPCDIHYIGCQEGSSLWTSKISPILYPPFRTSNFGDPLPFYTIISSLLTYRQNGEKEKIMNNNDNYRKIVVDIILGTSKSLLSRVKKLDTKEISSPHALITLLSNLDVPIITEEQIKEFAKRTPIKENKYFCMNTKKLIQQTVGILNNILLFVGDTVSFSEFEEVQMIMDFLIRFAMRLERYNRGYKLDFYVADGFIIGFRFV